MLCPTMSCSVRFCPVLPFPVTHVFVLSCSTISSKSCCFLSLHSILPSPISPVFALSCHILIFPVQPPLCFVLPCPTLFYHVLFIMPCPAVWYNAPLWYSLPAMSTLMYLTVNKHVLPSHWYSLQWLTSVFILRAFSFHSLKMNQHSFVMVKSTAVQPAVAIQLSMQEAISLNPDCLVPPGKFLSG